MGESGHSADEEALLLCPVLLPAQVEARETPGRMMLAAGLGGRNTGARLRRCVRIKGAGRRCRVPGWRSTPSPRSSPKPPKRPPKTPRPSSSGDRPLPKNYPDLSG